MPNTFPSSVECMVLIPIPVTSGSQIRHSPTGTPANAGFRIDGTGKSKDRCSVHNIKRIKTTARTALARPRAMNRT